MSRQDNKSLYRIYQSWAPVLTSGLCKHLVPLYYCKHLMMGLASRAMQGSLVTENQSCLPASSSQVLSSCSSPAWIPLGSHVVCATILWHKWHFAKITHFLDHRRQRPKPAHGQGRKIVCFTLTAEKLEEKGRICADTRNEC